jgi:hypothetical protein
MFRWSVSRLLPPVSYLTLLDQYTLISLVFISLNSIWHSIIGFLIQRLPISKIIDYYVLGVFTTFFVFYHLSVAYSLFQASHHRQLMLDIDRQYAKKFANTFDKTTQEQHVTQRV